MPIVNIIDCRTYKYNVNCDVAIEPAAHDNVCRLATQFVKLTDMSYEEVFDITIYDVINKYKNNEENVTLYLYDAGVLSSAQYYMR